MILTLPHFLVVSVLLLAAGIVTMLVKRSPLGIWMGIELVINAAALNFAAFNAYLPAATGHTPRVDGRMFVLFIIVVAAARTGVGLAIFLNLREHLRK